MNEITCYNNGTTATLEGKPPAWIFCAARVLCWNSMSWIRLEEMDTCKQEPCTSWSSWKHSNGPQRCYLTATNGLQPKKPSTKYEIVQNSASMYSTVMCSTVTYCNKIAQQDSAGGKASSFNHLQLFMVGLGIWYASMHLKVVASSRYISSSIWLKCTMTAISDNHR